LILSQEGTSDEPFLIIGVINHMKKISQALRETLTVAYPALLEISAESAAVQSEPGKWSPKQVMGHLIDSAANNHQRFVRAQQGILNMEPYQYAQNTWVDIQQYQELEWERVVNLWYHYNLHLCEVIARISEEKEGIVLNFGIEDQRTLRFVAEDYVAHLTHHLKSIPGLE
jgi:hypothetical protein